MKNKKVNSDYTYGRDKRYSLVYIAGRALYNFNKKEIRLSLQSFQYGLIETQVKMVLRIGAAVKSAFFFFINQLNLEIVL